MRSLRISFACLAATALIAVFVMSPQESISQSGTPITGYVWSDTVGWISLHCSNHGSCGTSNYGLVIATDGAISGYAWSENIGWISANSSDLVGCPSSPCTARMNELSMEGWLKALAANNTESGGWDGFISLSGASYGPTLSNGILSGYAWGDANIGWMDFDAGASPAVTVWLPPCALNYICTDETHRQNACTDAPIEACAGSNICLAGVCTVPPAPTSNGSSGNFRANPQLVAPGRTTNLTWDIQYADACVVTEDNPNINDVWDTITGNVTTSVIRIQTTYTLECTGPGGELTQTATVYQTPNWKEL